MDNRNRDYETMSSRKGHSRCSMPTKRYGDGRSGPENSYFGKREMGAGVAQLTLNENLCYCLRKEKLLRKLKHVVELSSSQMKRTSSRTSCTTRTSGLPIFHVMSHVL